MSAPVTRPLSSHSAQPLARRSARWHRTPARTRQIHTGKVHTTYRNYHRTGAKATLEVSKSLEETDSGLRVKETKSGETRRFSVPAEVLDVLREHRRVQDEDRKLYGADYANLGLIFARPDGAHYVPSNLAARG